LIFRETVGFEEYLFHFMIETEVRYYVIEELIILQLKRWLWYCGFRSEKAGSKVLVNVWFENIEWFVMSCRESLARISSRFVLS
jgi:hypothetical protein